MADKEFLVVGLGRFGGQVARTLASLGRSVLAVDVDEKKLNEVAASVTHVVQADASDEEVARSLGFGDFDTAIVAIGNDLESSVLTALLLKELGVRELIVKAASDEHGRLLLKLGVDRVVFPERDMGQRLARSLVSENLVDYLELTPEVSIAELMVDSGLAGHSLRDLDLIARFGATIMAVRGSAGEVTVSPAADHVLGVGDMMVLIATNADMARLQKWMAT